MIIIPFIHKSKMVATMRLTTFQILTIGGTRPWKEDDRLDVERDILHPNGIYLSCPPIRYQDMYLCPVDQEATKLDDFYQWKEIRTDDHETFCWRPFYMIGEASNYRGWLPVPTHESFGIYRYEEIFDAIQQHMT